MKHLLKFDINLEDYNDIADPKTGDEYREITGLSIKIEQTHFLKDNKLDDDFLMSYQPAKGDKIYFMPGCNVPRIKMKDLGLKYGIKTVRDYAEANVIIGGDSTASKILDRNWYYAVPTSVFKAFVEMHTHALDVKEVNDINTALEFYNNEYLICDWVDLRFFTDDEYTHHEELTKLNDFKDVKSSSISVASVESEYKKLYDYILTIPITHESTILEHLNSDDAVLIDEQMFEQLSEMLRSSDNDNTILAMEIMANCNYKQSLLYLEMLFHDHYYNISQSSTKNHVNFKSLLSYLNKDRSYLATDLDDIIKCLAKHNVLTKDKLDILLKKYNHEIIQRGSTDHFLVKSVTLSDEMLAKLKSDYTYYINEADADEETEFRQQTIQNDEEQMVLTEEEPVQEANLEAIATEPEPEEPEEKQEEIIVNPITEKNDTDNFEWF